MLTYITSRYCDRLEGASFGLRSARFTLKLQGISNSENITGAGIEWESAIFRTLRCDYLACHGRHTKWARQP